MAYGVVPIASAVSSMPQILAATGAGVACPVEDIDGLTAAIMNYVNNPAEWQVASRAGVAAAPQFGYRAYQAAVADLFRRAWGIELKTPAPTPATLAAVAPTLHATNGHVTH